MLKRIPLALASLLLLLSAAIAAPPAIVLDEAGVLGADVAAALTAKLYNHNVETKHQIVIVTIPDLGDTSIEEWTLAKGREWKLGRAADNNGIIFAIALNPKTARIEVGYGLEGVVTDAAARLILEKAVPLLRTAKYADAANQVVDDLIVLTKTEVVPDQPAGGVNWLAAGAIFGGSAVFAGLIWFFGRPKPRPPEPARRYRIPPPAPLRSSSSRPRAAMSSPPARRHDDSYVPIPVVIPVSSGRRDDDYSSRSSSPSPSRYSDDGGSFGGGGASVSFGGSDSSSSSSDSGSSGGGDSGGGSTD